MSLLLLFAGAVVGQEPPVSVTHRTLVVPYQPRVFTAPYQPRVFTVPYQPRTFTVPSEE